jgi:hypothetical protein
MSVVRCMPVAVVQVINVIVVGNAAVTAAFTVDMIMPVGIMRSMRVVRHDRHSRNPVPRDAIDARRSRGRGVDAGKRTGDNDAATSIWRGVPSA